MPQPTIELRRAIDRLLVDRGIPARELAQLVGVSEPTMSCWRSGKQNISNRHWAKLRAQLAPYLGQGPSAAPHDLDTNPQNPNVAHDAYYVPPGGMVDVPVLGLAAAAGYEPAVEPLDDFLSAFRDDTEAFPADAVSPGYFCLRASGGSMSPEYPDGTVLLVAGGEFPERGDLVAARLADQGEVIVKHYARRSGIVRLESEHPEGQNFEIDLKKEPGRLIWMWPVVRAQIELRKRRWERNRGSR